ncbi:porin [Psychrobacter sanguinis]|uniref:Porin n=1 Tax=Psychrobacter sanguinis TaxID=861445 RepID=A0A844M0A2_9GAMM|nr:porin [Psychrobacter sanguinis]MUG32204.1 porin [Psychrobacter sanguinis]
MKKLLLASAVAALSVSAANAAPTVYGKAFLTADYVNAEIDYPSNLNNLDREDDRYRKDVDEDTVEINSVGSKIGLKGSEPLSANTDVIYQLEYGIGVDGEQNTFKSRDTYLGLKNKDFGEFRVGRNFSVIDYVNNIYRTQGYFDNIGASTLRSSTEEKADDALIKALTLSDGSRINNSIVWIAPKYNNLPLELALMYGADEGFGSNDSGYGASLFYDAGNGITAGIAYDKDMSLSVDGDRWATNAAGDYILNNEDKPFKITAGGDLVRATASVDLAKFNSVPVTLGALYQEADYDFSGSKKEKGMIVSAQWALSNFAHPAAAYIQYDKTDNVGGIPDLDSDQVVVGGKYFYRNNIIAHAYAGVNSADRGATDAEVVAVGGGLEYLF